MGEPGGGWGHVVPGVELVNVGLGGEVAVAELERGGDFGVGGGVVGEVRGEGVWGWWRGGGR